MPDYVFNPAAKLAYFIIIQDRIRKHKMFTKRALFFVEKHEILPIFPDDCKTVKKTAKMLLLKSYQMCQS